MCCIYMYMYMYTHLHACTHNHSYSYMYTYAHAHSRTLTSLVIDHVYWSESLSLHLCNCANAHKCVVHILMIM